MTAGLSRRAALSAMAGSAVAAAVSTPSTARASVSVSHELPILIRRYRAALDVSWSYNAEFLEPAEAALRDALAAVPHHRTVASFTNVYGTRTRLSTDGPGTVAMARGTLADHVSKSLDANYRATAEEVCAAHDRREIEIARIRQAHPLDAMADEYDRLSDITHEALLAVYNFPSASLADVCAKIAFIEEDDGWGMPDAIDGIVADIRRLAGAA